MTFAFLNKNNDENKEPIANQNPKNVLVSKADQPHKVMNVAQTLQFVFLTILIGALLNASALITRAETIEDSFMKDTITTVLSPFDYASRALGLTSVRQSTREAMSLPRDDSVDTFTFEETEVETPPTTTLPLITPQNKLTMWLVGDSLSIIPSESIARNFSTEHFNILGIDGRVSTGMARTDVFNWFSHIREYVAANKPKVMVATFGANDDQSIYTENGFIGPFGSQAWKDEYAKRISSTIDFLESQGTFSIWIEIPPTRDPVRNDRYAIINEVTRNVVASKSSSARYIETKAAFTLPDGSYQDSLPINGNLTLLRAPDGIHLTRAGGNIVSDLVFKELLTLYSF